MSRAESGVRAWQQPLRILVVAGDRQLGEAVSLPLREAGHHVVNADSAASALHRATAFHPQVLLCDESLDDPAAPSLCQALRRQQGGVTLYCMLLTAAVDLPRRTAGVDDFITCPVIPHLLLARVQTGGRLIRLQTEAEQLVRLQAERERLSRQMQQAQKMQAIGKLTGGIAHNFNNILASILGYTELAQDMFADHGDGRLAEFLDNIHRAGIEARDLVASLRAFSEGNSDERQTPLMAPVLNDIVRMLQPILTASIALRTDFDEQIPVIWVNQEQIFQVMTHLCLNARDALPDSGEIRLTLRYVSEVTAVCNSCHERLQGGFVELSVADTGRGIATDVAQRMFDPFFSTKAVGKGTGLGLSLVHGIMHGYGGHVLFESKAAGGSTFRLLFPVLRADETPMADRGAAPHG